MAISKHYQGTKTPNAKQLLATQTFRMKRPKFTTFMNCSLLIHVTSFCRTIVRAIYYILT